MPSRAICLLFSSGVSSILLGTGQSSTASKPVLQPARSVCKYQCGTGNCGIWCNHSTHVSPMLLSIQSRHGCSFVFRVAVCVCEFGTLNVAVMCLFPGINLSRLGIFRCVLEHFDSPTGLVFSQSPVLMWNNYQSTSLFLHMPCSCT